MFFLLFIVAGSSLFAGELVLFKSSSEAKTEAAVALHFYDNREIVGRYQFVQLNEQTKCASGVRKGDVLTIPLFDDQTIRAKVSRTDHYVNGAFVVTARMEDGSGYLLLSTSDSRSLGVLSLPGKDLFYKIISDPVSLEHFLIEMTASEMPAPEECRIPEKPALGPADFQEQERIMRELEKTDTKADDLVTVDVLIAYTPGTKTWAEQNGGGIKNVVAMAMANAQLTLENSETLTQFRLVHAGLVHYEEAGGNSNADLRRFTASPDFNPWGNEWQGYDIPGHMDVVHEWREIYGADMCAILTSTGDVAGLAWQLTNRNGSPNYAFSLTRVQWAVSNFVLIHEIGHNMGCMHNRDQNQSAGPTNWSNWPENTWSSGGRWVGNDNGRYCSVMTYASGSYYSDGRTHTRVAYFSNPDVTHQGVPTGDPQLADNARTIREMRHVFAAYRPEGTRFSMLDQFDLLNSGYGIATDGHYLYVSGSNPPLISRYSTDGDHVDSFALPGADMLYELAYDGQYFYGANGTSGLLQMDFSEKTLVGTIATDIDNIQSLAYDREQDAFWVGAGIPDAFHLVNRQGETLRSVENTSALSEVSGIALDPVSSEDGVLWVYGTKDAEPASNNLIYKIPLADGAASTVSSLDLQPVLDKPGQAGGLTITPLLVPGKWVTLGLSYNTSIWMGEALDFLIEMPQTLTARAIEGSKIQLDFLPNAANQDVVIVYNLSGEFGAPAGSPPAPGEAFAGGTLLYHGASSPVIHSGLESGQPVFYRAFSYFREAYSEGRASSAVTLYTSVPDSIADADGNNYSIVQIGNQLWTRENLRTTRFNNLDEISRNTNVWTGSTPHYDIAPHTAAGTSGIDSEEEMAAIYGLQYNWYAAQDQRGICPGNWRVPSLADWNELLEYMTEVHAGVEESNIGNTLKINRQVNSPLEGAATGEHPRWNEDGTHHANNASGLGLLPGGYRHTNGTTYNIGSGAYHWESSGRSISLRSFSGEVHEGSMDMNSGFHLRCLTGFTGQDVRFSVTDGDKSVSGAEIRINDATHVSNEEGKTRFVLPAGNHSYSINARGYAELTDVPFVLGSEDKDIAVSLTRSAYFITAGAGEHGSIEPSGEVEVAPGSNQAFTITPNSGYRISSVVVDGNSINLGSDNSWDAGNRRYTFNSVADDHSIQATFEVDDTGIYFPETLRLSVYPNPASKSIHVSVDRHVKGNAILSLYSLQGRLLQQHQLTIDGPVKYTLDASSLPAGIYLLQLKTDRFMAVERVVVSD